jgi:hypothetical protein
MRSITMAGIAWRFLFAFALICFTWNPTPYNYIEWAYARIQIGSMVPLVAFVGVVLLIGWVFFVRSTMRSLGPWGIFLAMGLAATVLWILLRYDPGHIAPLKWVGMVLIAGILTAGMSWSHLRRRWAGQADVDDIDDR